MNGKLKTTLKKNTLLDDKRLPDKTDGNIIMNNTITKMESHLKSKTTLLSTLTLSNKDSWQRSSLESLLL
jgi:hypothetical protein